MPTLRAVFLDRDGTLNEDLGYVHSKEQWIWLPKAIDALALLQNLGFLLIVVSNQSGIARNFYTEEDLAILTEEITQDLAKHSVHIHAWYHCPHLPAITGPCDCRKPKPGMLLQAAEEHGINLAASYLIGDRMTDMEAGRACGCTTLKISSTACEDRAAQADAIPVFKDLYACALSIKDQEAAL